MNEEELINIEGQIYTEDFFDPQNTVNPINGEGTYIDENGNIKEFKIKIKERLNNEKVRNILWSITNLGGSTNGFVALSSCLATLAGADSQTIQNINNFKYTRFIWKTIKIKVLMN